MIIDQEPEAINAVLTFVDPDGRRWMAAALVGALYTEEGPDERLPISMLLDRPLALAAFTLTSGV